MPTVPVTKAMVLAAGQGTRLRPLTETIPKCMVPVGGKPVLEHVIERLHRAGVEEIVINLSHLPDAVAGYFDDGRRWGLKLTYSIEPRPLGTAGGLRSVRWFFDRTSYVWYGDNLSTCNLTRLVAHHWRKDAAATVALFHREDSTSSGIADLDAGDRIVRFVEKPRPEHITSHWVNAGIYVIEPEVVSAIPEDGTPDFGKDVFPTLLARGVPVYGYRMSPEERLWWIDTADDLRRVQTQVTAEMLMR